MEALACSSTVVNVCARMKVDSDGCQSIRLFSTTGVAHEQCMRSLGFHSKKMFALRPGCAAGREDNLSMIFECRSSGLFDTSTTKSPVHNTSCVLPVNILRRMLVARC